MSLHKFSLPPGGGGPGWEENAVLLALTLTSMSLHDTVAEPVAVEDEEDFGADLSDDELGELLVREITIDGMCGVY